MIILASSSTRRRDLMQMAGFKFMVSATQCNEATDETDPEKHTLEVAKRKVLSARYADGDIVVGADTMIYLDGEIIGKPKDADDAKVILHKLSGKTHTVYTSTCISCDDVIEEFCVKTDVTFFPLSPTAIDMYVATGEPMDKAGAYGIQGRGALLIEKINGDFYATMGLPIARVARILKGKCKAQIPKTPHTETIYNTSK